MATLYKHLRFVGRKGTMNALFLKDLAAKTHRGLRGRVEKGRSGGGLCYGCSNHVMNDSCSDGRGIRRSVIEERVLAGLKDRPMAPEAAAEAMLAYAEETNRINRERRASGASDRKELADVEKKIASMIAVIKDGGYVRGIVDRLRELEARQDELDDGFRRRPPTSRTSIRTSPASTAARWPGSPKHFANPKNVMLPPRPSAD